MNIFWLEDEEDTIITEKNRLFKYTEDILVSQSPKGFITAMEDNSVKDEDIFILDIMMPTSQDLNFTYLDKNKNKVKETMSSHVSAGIEFYDKFIREMYPKNKVIFYSIRADKEQVEMALKKYDTFGETMFFVYKMDNNSLKSKIKEILS